MAEITRSEAEIAEVFDRALAASHLGDEHEERDDFAEGALATLQYLTGQGGMPEFLTESDFA